MIKYKSDWERYQEDAKNHQVCVRDYPPHMPSEHGSAPRPDGTTRRLDSETLLDSMSEYVKLAAIQGLNTVADMDPKATEAIYGILQACRRTKMKQQSDNGTDTRRRCLVGTRQPRDFHRRCVIASSQENMSLNAWVHKVLQEYMEANAGT